jgi:hypothetical protein
MHTPQMTGELCSNTNVCSSKQNFFLTNNEYHNLDTRQGNNLYLPQANLTINQKVAYYSGIKIVNSLPLEIKNVAGNKKKIALKKIFIHFSF